MTHFLRTLLAALAFLPLTALADSPLHWRCWYDQKIHIHCLIDEVPDAGTPAPAMNLPGNLPAIVAQLRQDPRAFRGDLVRIPLHTPPIDMDFTALLAKASVCGSRPDCSVNFTQREPGIEELATLVTKHADPLSSGTQLARADSR